MIQSINESENSSANSINSWLNIHQVSRQQKPKMRWDYYTEIAQSAIVARSLKLFLPSSAAQQVGCKSWDSCGAFGSIAIHFITTARRKNMVRVSLNLFQALFFNHTCNFNWKQISRTGVDKCATSNCLLFWGCLARATRQGSWTPLMGWGSWHQGHTPATCEDRRPWKRQHGRNLPRETQMCSASHDYFLS